MLQEQTPNLFGFVIADNKPSGLQQTAKFFNPIVNDQETSFSTETTDITYGFSAQSTPSQICNKVNIKKKGYNGKRILSAHTNNHKKNCELPQLQSPSLVTLKSAPPVDQAPTQFSKPRPLIRNCVSQESIRKRLEPHEIFNFENGGDFITSRNFMGQKRSSFFQNNCQNQNLIYVSDSELYAEKENFQDSPDFVFNDKPFRIRNQLNNGKVTIEKFNRIKVISVIPPTDNSNIPQKQTPAFVKRGFSDKKILRIDTKTAGLQLDLDDPKLVLHQYPQSTQVKATNIFMFPNSATSKAKVLSPLQPQNIEIVNRSHTPSSANLRKTPIFLNKCDDYEPLKGLQELRSPLVQGEGNLVMKKFQSERVNYMESVKNLEIGGSGSPIVRVRSNMCFKRSAFAGESSAQSPTGQLGVMKIQRVNSKFKNQEAVLDKLFNPMNANKKE